MTDDQIPDPTRVLARLHAHAAATRATDPRFGDLEPLRWRDHGPVLALIRDRANNQRSIVNVEIPGTGPIRQFARSPSWRWHPPA